MRTTVDIEDGLLERLKTLAADRGVTVSRLLEAAARVMLQAQEQPGSEPATFQLVTWGEGGVKPGIDLDRTSVLMAAEDGVRYRIEK